MCYRYVTYKTPFGNLYLIEKKSVLVEISFKCPQNLIQLSTPFLKKVSCQLDEYFLLKRRHFDFPFELSGTPFQQKVWKALLGIAYGETVSYQYIACQIGNPKAARAVGQACHQNKLPFIVPCHRVVSTTGKLTGYAGGLNVKQYLLSLERKQ